MHCLEKKIKHVIHGKVIPKILKKFYYYTECALHFILGIAEHCKKNNLDLEYDTPSGPYLDDVINMIKYCLKYYRICINIIKLP